MAVSVAAVQRDRRRRAPPGAGLTWHEDPRDDDRREEQREHEERTHHEQPHDDGPAEPPWGRGRMEAGLAFEDWLVDPDVLERVVPLSGRWPEPRLLDQTGVWFSLDRRRIDLDAIDAGERAGLLDALRLHAREWHAAAVVHEAQVTSTALRWMYGHCGVLSAERLGPLAWLETTPLVRWLRTGERTTG